MTNDAIKHGMMVGYSPSPAPTKCLTDRVADLEKGLDDAARAINGVRENNSGRYVEMTNEINKQTARFNSLAEAVERLEGYIKSSAWFHLRSADCNVHVVSDDVVKVAIKPSPSVHAVPPLPEHPRFRMEGEQELFCTSSEENLESCWVEINDCAGQLLEECCAIARCWWHDKFLDSTEYEQENEAEANMEAWHTYAQRGKR